MKFCPACVNDFLLKNDVYELADEIFDLNHPDSSVTFELCPDHWGRKLVKEVEKARKATKPRFDEVMAIEVHPSKPSQKNIKLVKG